MSEPPVRRVVFHVARTPMTGVWAMMTMLADWQSSQPGTRAAIGVIADRTWPEPYHAAFKSCRLEKYLCHRPWLGNGTLSFLSQVAWSPVGKWVRALDRRFEPAEIVVHLHNAWLSGSLLPIRAQVAARVGVVVTFHGIADQAKLKRRPWQCRMHRWMAQRIVAANAMLASVDQANIPVAEELFGLDPARFSVVANASAANPRPSCPRLLGAEHFTVGFVSTLYPGKGWQIAGAAIDKLHHEGKPIRYLVAGSGADEEAVRAWTSTRPGYTKFLGFVSRPEEAIFPKLDALVLPSLTEGMPMVLLEALAAGVPILATPVGGIPAILDDGATGFLISRDPDTIGDRLRTLIDHPDRHRAMSQACRQAHAERYSPAACGAAYDRLYCRALTQASLAAGATT